MHPRADISIPWASDAAQERVLQIQASSEPGTPADLERAVRAVHTHVRQMDGSGLVLYAGSNAMTGAVASAHGAKVGIRPSLGDPGEKVQPGLEHLEVLEVLTTRVVAATMRASHADVRVQSATLANLAVYAGLTAVGATIAALPRWAGGHFSHHQEGAAGIRGHRVVELPYDVGAHDVDLEALPAFLERECPSLVVLGGTLMLFPHRLDRIVEAIKRSGAKVLYDAGRLRSLGVAAAELLNHGSEYAARCIDSARALGQALSDAGLPVVGAERAFTDSHHLAVALPEAMTGDWAVGRLARAGMYLSATQVGGPNGPVAALRLGTRSWSRAASPRPTCSTSDS